MATNEEQVAFWSGASGDAWSAQQERMDRQLDPLGRAAMDALAPRSGERVADIGCGAGTTTQQLAARVAPNGTAVGFDISAPLLALARRRAPQLSFVQADAQVHAFAPGSFDAVFSRFGVMFFADPVAAFRNIASAVRPGGRLAFVCWRDVSENPVMTVPLEAAIAVGLPRPPPSVDPRAPGPFAFSDRAYVTDILTKAGWSDIALTPHDERVGGNDLETTLEVSMQIGPLGRMLREHPQHRDAALHAVRAALVPFVVNGVVLQPSATWIVTARRSD